MRFTNSLAFFFDSKNGEEYSIAINHGRNHEEEEMGTIPPETSCSAFKRTASTLHAIWNEWYVEKIVYDNVDKKN